MVRLSFPNFANSFQKYRNFYTTQQNVSHPSPLFLRHFWDHNMHQSALCWQMLLSSLTILQVRTPQSLLADATRMKSLWEIPPVSPLTYCLQTLDCQTERWNLIRSLLLLPYIKATIVPHAEQGQQTHLSLRTTCIALAFLQLKFL